MMVYTTINRTKKRERKSTEKISRSERRQGRGREMLSQVVKMHIYDISKVKLFSLRTAPAHSD